MMRLLQEIEDAGFSVRLSDGKLYGSRNMPDEYKQLIAENKDSLIAVITCQCPTCNQPLRVEETDTYKYLQCPTDALHYCELYNKVWGKPCFISSGGVKPEKCKKCKASNDGPYVYCNKCWLQLIEEDMAEQES